MAFFEEADLQAITIERMVFHLVGPKAEDFVRLEAVDPKGFAGFFLDRIRSVNSGLPYIFRGESKTRERLNRIATSAKVFQEESERLADDFQQLHGGAAAAGALLIFVLDVRGAKSFAVLKYDDEIVLAYEVEEAEGGRKRVSLEELQRTFVQNKAALQKSALIRLNAKGGELTVLDRRNQQRVAQYFENFLDAIRVHEDAELTAKLVDVTRAVIKENRDHVPKQVLREVTKRTYEAALAGGKIDSDDQKSFLDTVMGRKLPDDDPLVAKFKVALRRAHIDGTPVMLNPEKVTRPTTVRYRTKKGIQIWAPTELESLIDTSGGRIVIKDPLDVRYDDTD